VDKRLIRLKTKINDFPEQPGVYFFKDNDHEVIYIGKARSLRSRVKSYFSPTSDTKVQAILRETQDIDYILTGTAKEAAFLENNLIQQAQPKFNLRLKDDKSFPYLKITTGDRFPGIYLTRKVEPDGARYFGPFSPAFQARRTIQLVSRYFGIRTCREKIPGNRKRPCLEYDMHLCSAPCTGVSSEKNYAENVANALLLLQGKVDELRKIIRRKMREAADSQAFEKAALWRDLLGTLAHIQEKPTLISVRLDDKDIVGFSSREGYSLLYVFLMRSGKVRECRSFLRKDRSGESQDEQLSLHMSDFYRGPADIPREIILPFLPADPEGWKQRLREKTGKKVMLKVPRKGTEKKLVEMACRNAENALHEETGALSVLEETARILGLESTPSLIEGFDVSNTGGRESVGSLVVFERGLPRKELYRKFRIKTVSGVDDVASLSEIIRRRYTRLLKEGGPLPDLVFVDGGKGQLGSALKTLEELGLGTIPVVSLAKRQEILYTRDRKEGLKLEGTSPVRKLFQNIRDESHRFAIAYHRLRRKERSFASALDGIPGLGEKKRSRILARYKSLHEILAAPEEELARFIGKKTARALQEALHQPGSRLPLSGPSKQADFPREKT